MVVERSLPVAPGTAVVLSAGPIDHRRFPIGMNVSSPMIPVNGRPVIGWILDDLIRKGITRTTLVIREDDAHCRDFLQRGYEGRIRLRVATVHGDGSLLTSLQAGLRATDNGDGPVR